MAYFCWQLEPKKAFLGNQLNVFFIINSNFSPNFYFKKLKPMKNLKETAANTHILLGINQLLIFWDICFITLCIFFFFAKSFGSKFLTWCFTLKYFNLPLLRKTTFSSICTRLLSHPRNWTLYYKIISYIIQFEFLLLSKKWSLLTPTPSLKCANPTRSTYYTGCCVFFWFPLI